MARSNSPATRHRVVNGAQLAETLASAILRLREGDALSRIVVVCPSYFSAASLRTSVVERITSSHSGGILNVEFTTMNAIADAVLESASFDRNRPRMTSAINRELVYNAIHQVNDDGTELLRADSEATLNAVWSSIRQIELLPDDAKGRFFSHAGGPSYDAMVRVYRHYRQHAGNYLSGRDIAEIASEAARNDPERLQHALGKHQIVVGTHAPDNVYAPLLDTLSILSSALLIQSDPKPTPIDGVQRNASRFFTCINPADEPRQLIRNIVADAKAGVRFNDMAVYVPARHHLARIRDALDAAEIPCVGPEPRSLTDTPAGRFVRLLLRLVSSGLRRDAFGAWITAAPVVDPNTKRTVPDARWDDVTRQAKIRHFDSDSNWKHRLDLQIKTWQYDIARAKRHRDDGDVRETKIIAFGASINRARELSEFLTGFLTKVRHNESASWSTHVDWLTSLIDDYCHHPSNDDEASENLDVVVSKIEELRRLDAVSNVPVRFERFASQVSHSLNAGRLTLKGIQKSVLVAPVDDAAGCSYKSVHILGMTEGHYPGGTNADPLLPDDVRSSIDPNGETLATRQQRIDQSRNAFLNALNSAPNRNLYWVQSESGATSALYPSAWYIDELRASAKLHSLKVEEVMERDSKYVEQTPSLLSAISISGFGEDYDFDLNRFARINANTRTREAYLNAEPDPYIVRGKRMTDARNSNEFTEFDGNAMSMSKSFEGFTSASNLQTYATCPYQWFLANALGIGEVVDVDRDDYFTLTPLAKGAMVHEILEEFVGRRDAKDFDGGESELLKGIAKDAFEKYQESEPILFPTLFEIEKEQMLRDLETWRTSEIEESLQGYTSINEMKFAIGDEGVPATVELPDSGVTIRFRGVIDRLAIAPDGKTAKVIDYKSGRERYYRDTNKDVVDKGKKIQIPVYMLAAKQNRPELEVITGAFWFVLDKEAKVTLPRKYAPLGDAERRLNEAMEIVGGGIAGGNFPARKQDDYTQGSTKKCAFCPFDTICPSDREVAWRRVKNQPEVLAYSEMTDGSAE